MRWDGSTSPPECRRRECQPSETSLRDAENPTYTRVPYFGILETTVRTIRCGEIPF